MFAQRMTQKRGTVGHSDTREGEERCSRVARGHGRQCAGEGWPLQAAGAVHPCYEEGGQSKGHMGE